MIRFQLLCAAAAISMGAAAHAQAVPSTTGDMTAAPRSVARGGAVVETAPAARTKARARTRTHPTIAGAGLASGAGVAAPHRSGTSSSTPSGAQSAAPADGPLTEVAFVRA